MANCAKCDVEHTRTRGRKDPRPQSYCAACHATYMRANRVRFGLLSRHAKRRAIARAYANVYQRRGKLKPQPCERCATVENVQKHHEDYTQPLLVRWLCRPCHHELHMEELGK